MSMSIKDAGRLGLALAALLAGFVVLFFAVLLVIAAPARAQGFTFGPGATGFGAAPKASSAATGSTTQNFFQILTTLGLTTNLVLVLDSGAAASYTSGQSWLDLAGSGYDFFRGANVGAAADDPTFNGSAGALTSSEYWSLDGGDFFTYDSANETWMNGLHKDSAKFTLIEIIYPADLTGFDPAVGTGADGAVTTEIGVRLGLNAGKTNILVANGGVVDFALNKSGATSATQNAWNMNAMSIDEAGGNVSHMYLNGAINQVGGSNTFDATYLTPSAAASDHTMRIGRSVTSYDAAGTRRAILAMWSGTALTKANFDSIWTQIRTRFSL